MNFFKRSIVYGLIMINLCSTPIEAKYIIFDMGDILVSHSPLSVALDLGISELLLYAIEENKSPASLVDTALELLKSFGLQHEDADHPLATVKGKMLPQIMCDWFCGIITHQQIMQKAQAIFRKHEHFFSQREKELLSQIFTTIFDPQALIKYLNPIPEGMRLVRKCAAKRNKKGKREHTLLILSNWDAGSFELLRSAEQTKDIFKYFNEENIFVSSHMGMMKPHKNIFQKILADLRIKAQDCVFIDDQEENICTARLLGFNTIHVPHKDFRHAERELERLGIL